MTVLKNRSLLAIVLGCLLAVQPSFGSFQERPSIALDHVVLAVNDLEATAARYRQLGFALKPGQPHANGIRNQHVKFTNGTELELLTAPAAADDLTTRYRRHLADGDGPAYLALFPQPQTPARSEDPATSFSASVISRRPIARSISRTGTPRTASLPCGSRARISRRRVRF